MTVLPAGPLGHVVIPVTSFAQNCTLLWEIGSGHAVVIDPWGHVLADAGEGPGLAIAEIDPARLATVRAQLPCLAHRR